MNISANEHNATYPIYPYFKDVEIYDRDIIDTFFEQNKPYSDFSFTNLYIWRPGNIRSQFSFLNRNLVIKVKNILTNKDEVSFLGVNEIHSTILKLIGDYQKLDLVPSIVVSNLEQTDNLLITEDEDNFDYIMATSELSSLAGYKYIWKRRDINRITRLNLQTVTNVGKLDNKLKEDITKLYYKWLEQKRTKNSDIQIENEIAAFHLYIEEPQLHNNLLTTCVYDKSNLISFSFNELVHDKYALGLFAKSNYNYPGITSFNEVLTAQTLKDYGYRYLNYEQDLGIASLRHYKLSLSPVSFLKKYKIKLK